MHFDKNLQTCTFLHTFVGLNMSNTMKKLLLVVLLILVSVAGIAYAQSSSGANALIINRADGVKEYLALNQKFRIETSDNTLRLVHPDVTVEFALGDVEKFTFGNHGFAANAVYEGDHNMSSIDDVREREISITSDAISASVTIVVFDLNGREVARGLSVKTAALPAGIYIVKIGSTTLKLKL